MNKTTKVVTISLTHRRIAFFILCILTIATLMGSHALLEKYQEDMGTFEERNGLFYRAYKLEEDPLYNSSYYSGLLHEGVPEKYFNLTDLNDPYVEVAILNLGEDIHIERPENSTFYQLSFETRTSFVKANNEYYSIHGYWADYFPEDPSPIIFVAVYAIVAPSWLVFGTILVKKHIVQKLRTIISIALMIATVITMVYAEFSQIKLMLTDQTPAWAYLLPLVPIYCIVFGTLHLLDLLRNRIRLRTSKL